MSTLSPKVAALIAVAKLKHAALLEAKQAAAAAASEAPATLVKSMATPLLDSLPAKVGGMEFNTEQEQAIEMALQGKPSVLIGPAGAGKTTVMQEIISRLETSSHVMPFASSTKHLYKGAPGIVVVGYTNKAVNNIKKKLPERLQGHCITMHKLIEFAPEYYEIPDPVNGGFKTTMRFAPTYGESNKLPHISCIIFEESSMIGTDLYDQVIAALPSPAQTQQIFLGDLNQLLPVFGPSILGFKLDDLPVIELVKIYRQALLSPIISLATAIRSNDFSHFPELKKPLVVPPKGQPAQPLIVDRQEHGKVTIQPWRQRVSGDTALKVMQQFLPTSIDNKIYDPEEDIILCPFNVSLGTIELNKIVANHISTRDKQEVHEVIARYVKSYWAVGDRVMVDRHEAKITKIEPTIGYLGSIPQAASLDLDRWGMNRATKATSKQMTADEVLNVLDTLGGEGDDNSKNLASHTIHVYIPDLDQTRRLTTAGEINNLLFGYALTVHKSQGSEWRKVFLVLHNSHATMCSRELVYTAVTRAKEELFIICEGDIKPYKNTLVSAANRGMIPGITLKEKIAFFTAKKASRSNGINSN